MTRLLQILRILVDSHLSFPLPCPSLDGKKFTQSLR
jgi:hypothetical protein